MRRFKVGDEVQLVRDRWEFKRRTKAMVDDPNEKGCYVIIKQRRVYFDNSDLRPYVKRKREKAPTKSDISKLRQEIATRNKAIEQLEADNEIYLSEKNRLGEQVAWLTEQNDALRKEVIAANQAHEIQHNKTLQYQRLYETYQHESNRISHEQASTALRCYIYKVVAITLFALNCVLGGLLVVG